MKKLILLTLILTLSQNAHATHFIAKIKTTCSEAQIKSYFPQGLKMLRPMGPGKFAYSLDTTQLTDDTFKKTLRAKGCLAQNTKFKDLAEALKQADVATSLDLSRKGLTSVPKDILKLKKLKTLSLTNNQITEIPEWMTELTELENLFLNSNQLSVFPKSVLKMTQLKKLELAKNKLTEIPQDISNLSQLTLLSIGENQIKALPEGLYDLTLLEDLKIYGNQITTLSPKLNNLIHLQKFMVGNKFYGGNPIQSLPSNLSGLVNLKSIDLPQTQITTLPDSLLALPNLKTIWVPSALSNEMLEALKKKHKNIVFMNM